MPIGYGLGLKWGQGMGGGGAQSYGAKVLGYSPIAYWPLWETTGTTAVCQVNTAQSGTYARDVSTMGTGTGIGDGNTAPLFDGTNDFLNAYTATFAGAYSGAAGSLIIWAKVFNVGVWTDGNTRNILSFQVDNDNMLIVRKNAGNNQVYWRYEAGTTQENTTKTGVSTTDWVCYGLTWSKAAEEVKAYYNGAQEGATLTALGTWAGTFSSTKTVIASSTLGPWEPWNAWLAHCAFWTTALTAPQMLDLATV